MANREQVAMLRRNVAEWNAWREQNRHIVPNLRGADLRGYNLTGANLFRADIRGASFKRRKRGKTWQVTSLKNANLKGAIAGVENSPLLGKNIIVFSISGSGGFLSSSLGWWIFQLSEQIPILAGQVYFLSITLFCLATTYALVAFQGFNTRSIVNILIFAFLFSLPISIFIFPLVFGAMTVLMAVTLTFATFFSYSKYLTIAHLMGAFFILIAEDTAFSGIGGVTVALISCLFGMYLSRYYVEEGDEKFIFARQFVVDLNSFGGTNFEGTDLTEANLSNALLRSANFDKAILVRTRFFDSIQLDRSNPGTTYLENYSILKLLVDPNSGYQADLSGLNLRGVYLANANLQKSNLARTDLADSDLSCADLSGANLREANCAGTDFTSACLTGSCLEAWNVSETTILKNIDCQHVFLLERENENGSRERRPHDSKSSFQPGDFEKLFGEAANLVELLIRDGLDLEACAAMLQKLMKKFDLTLGNFQSIQRKNSDILFTLKVSKDTDKGDLERTGHRSYEEELDKVTAERDAARLEADTAKQHSQDILGLAKSFANRPIKIEQEITQNPTITQEGGRQINQGDNSSYDETNVSDEGQYAGRDINNDRDPDDRAV
ncbi:MAG: pentapeptide repeat-containing protein [Geitlerinemataceae cyanobacterium]